uniref:Uncharacterized protein n=1 Tax=viral metagenome TaxID=1070528 RepID=A0A6C0E9E7_9ZZZZ
MSRRRNTSRNSRENSPNSIINISSPIPMPGGAINIATSPIEIHPNITVRDRDRTRRRRPMTPDNPPPYVTIREPGSPRRRRRALTIDDDEEYDVRIELGNENTYSLSPTNDVAVVGVDGADDDDNDMYGINLAEPISHERNEEYNITGLSNKELDKHKDKIKIKKTQTVIDPIMMDEINIHDYIKEDVDNIVFVYENNYYLSTKTILSNFINMTTTNNAIVFDCRGIGYRNVNYDYPYVSIKYIGIILNEFSNVISLETAIAITKPNSGQYFFIKGTNDVLISTVIDNVLNGKYPNAVAASRCQSGKSAIVYDIQTFKPEYTSHSKSPKKTAKKHGSKSPKKTIKKHVKRILK